MGVVNLEDKTATIDVGGQKFQMSGLRSSANLDYDYSYYKKGLAEIQTQRRLAVLSSSIVAYAGLF